MTLIVLLCGLGTEYFLKTLDEVRVFGWFNRYSQWLTGKLEKSKYLRGVPSLIILLVGPLLLIVLIQCGLMFMHDLLIYPFALIVLLYSVGPVFLDRTLGHYAQALDDEDEAKARHYAEELCQSKSAPDPDQDESAIISGIFVEANERLYGVILWFVLLGPLGALLYRFANLLKSDYQETQSSLADAVRRLHHILNWPSVRLLALGNALSGNMVAALGAWRDKEALSLTVNEDVVIASGRAALQYPADRVSTGDGEVGKSHWIREARSLINRTLIVWLALLGLITIVGWMS